MEISSLQNMQSLMQVMGLVEKDSTDSTQSDTMAMLMQAQTKQLTLSAVGKGLSRANQVASSSGDEAVMAGFKAAVSALTSSSMESTDFSALRTLNTLATDDPDTLKSVLSTVNTLSTDGQSGAIRTYLTAATDAYEKSGASAVSSLNANISTALAENKGDNSAITKALSDLFQQYLTSPTSVSTAATAANYSTEILAYQMTAKL